MKFKDNNHNSDLSVVKLHEGHRQRLTKRLMDSKFVEAEDYNVLEYLLTMVVSRRDTNPLGHNLIAEFGSIANVLDASPEDLLRVKGVTPRIANFLTSLPLIFRNYKLSKLAPKTHISCSNDVFNYLGQCIYHLPSEEFYIICMDNGNNVISHKIISAGNDTEVSIKMADAVDYAKKVKAKKVILLHNHPAGSCDPSDEDLVNTRRFYMAFIVQGISLYDHIIVNSREQFYSFANEGLIKNYSEESNNMFFTINTKK